MLMTRTTDCGGVSRDRPLRLGRRASRPNPPMGRAVCGGPAHHHRFHTGIIETEGGQLGAAPCDDNMPTLRRTMSRFPGNSHGGIDATDAEMALDVRWRIQ